METNHCKARLNSEGGKEKVGMVGAHVCHWCLMVELRIVVVFGVEKGVDVQGR